jgi:hypothetical protein
MKWARGSPSNKEGKIEDGAEIRVLLSDDSYNE